MKPERWQQVEGLCQAALDRAPSQRAAFLEVACADDAELRREVESLLAYQAQAEPFIETPALQVAAGLLNGEETQSLVGRSFGHYQISELIGRGGMGEVYLAEDSKLGRKVALKLLPAAFTQDKERVRRFELEARAASALNHPNILTIYEVGEADQTRYIATEYIAGQTLRAQLKQGALPLEGVLDVAVQVASALTAAHEGGIIHRDIKPENIMVRRDGLVKVLDFGLAKLTAHQMEAHDSNKPTMPYLSTTPGVVMGTVQYMSPEQARGLEVDARTDIFSLGAVLYEMVKGQRAFRGDSQMALLTAVIEREPEPLPALVPDELAKAIMRCLRKDPARRYQTMADLKVSLEDLREESTASRQVRAPAPRRWTWAAWPLAILIFILLGLFAWQVWRAPQSTEPLRAIPLTTLSGVSHYPSFSPDGNYVVFTWTGPKQDNPDIYVQQIGAGSPSRRTTDPGNDYNPVWSSDGHWIAFLRSQAETGESELRLIPPLGGAERKLAEIRVRGGYGVSPPYLAWCPDSNCLVVTDSPGEGKSDALFVVSLETGEKRQLTNPQLPALGDTNPAVSPDGSWLVFRRSISLFTAELYRLPLGRDLTVAGEPQRLTPTLMDARHPTWLPDSREILFSAKGSLWRLVVPGKNTPARLPFVGEDGQMPVVSRPQPGRPSRLIYYRSFEDANIWRVETMAAGAPAPSLPVRLISSTRYDGMAQFSPDGRRVAFSSNRSGEGEIWLADPDGANAFKLTSTGAVIATGYPRWSPDGRLITFHSVFEGQSEVYVIPAAGGKLRNLTSHPANDGFPSFSRDGQWIYFGSNRTGEERIWKIPASGGTAVQVTNSAGLAPSESPDGAYIYYVETIDKPSPLWRLPAAGGAPVKVLEGVILANYVVLEQGIYYIERPAGQGGVYYFDTPSGETRLQYFDFPTRRSTTVARNLGPVDLPLTVSADGRTILYTRVDSSVDDLMLVENFR